MADFIEQIYNKGSVSGGQIAKKESSCSTKKYVLTQPSLFYFFLHM